MEPRISALVSSVAGPMRLLISISDVVVPSSSPVSFPSSPVSGWQLPIAVSNVFLATPEPKIDL